MTYFHIFLCTKAVWVTCEKRGKKEIVKTYNQTNNISTTLYYLFFFLFLFGKNYLAAWYNPIM